MSPPCAAGDEAPLLPPPQPPAPLPPQPPLVALDPADAPVFWTSTPGARQSGRWIDAAVRAA